MTKNIIKVGYEVKGISDMFKLRFWLSNCRGFED